MEVYFLFLLLPSHQSIFLWTNFLLDNLNFKKLSLQNWHFYRVKVIDMDCCSDLDLLLL